MDAARLQQRFDRKPGGEHGVWRNAEEQQRGHEHGRADRRHDQKKDPQKGRMTAHAADCKGPVV